MNLTVRECMVLDLERSWWKYAGAKEAAIRETLGMSSVRYHQVLNALIDRPEALAYSPMVVRRLLRLRAERQASRTGLRARRGVG